MSYDLFLYKSKYTLSTKEITEQLFSYKERLAQLEDLPEDQYDIGLQNLNNTIDKMLFPVSDMQDFYDELMEMFPALESYSDEEADEGAWSVTPSLDSTFAMLFLSFPWPQNLVELENKVLNLAARYGITIYNPQEDVVISPGQKWVKIRGKYYLSRLRGSRTKLLLILIIFMMFLLLTLVTLLIILGAR